MTQEELDQMGPWFDDEIKGDTEQIHRRFLRDDANPLCISWYDGPRVCLIVDGMPVPWDLMSKIVDTATNKYYGRKNYCQETFEEFHGDIDHLIPPGFKFLFTIDLRHHMFVCWIHPE